MSTQKDDFFELFRSRWKLASEAEKEQRENELADLEFEAGQHWSDEDVKLRKLESKPTVTIDLLSGPIKQVTNQQRTARPGIQISAVGEGSDPKKAQIWQGIVRRVERLSQAGRIYTWAGEHQVKMGRGFWVVRNQYVGDSDIQDIRIEEVDNQHTVYVDPSKRKLDGSDKKWAIRFEDLTHEDYKARFGEDENDTLSDKIGSGQFQGIGDAPAEWITSTHCRIAEYYYLEPTTTKKKYDSGRERTITKNVVKWCLLNAVGDVLDEATIPGQHIPVVEVYGERRNINGKVDKRGLVRMAKEASRMEDFCESSLMEAISTAKTAPWVVEWDSVSEFATIWNTSNKTNYAVLPYKRTVVNGVLGDKPERVSAGVDVSHLTMAAQRMQNHVRSVTGTDLNISETGAEERRISGKAYEARRASQQLGTSDYMENLGDGIVLTAKIIMGMARELYDTPRVFRIMGEDEKERGIVTHMGPDQAQAAQELAKQHLIAEMFDLSGSPDDYDVAISPGRNYQTARQEAVDMIGAAIQAYPPIAPIALPILFRNSDFEGAQEIAAKLEPDTNDQIPPAVQAQMQQLQQQLQEAADIIKTDQVKMQGQIATKQIETEAKIKLEMVQMEHEITLQQMKDATAITVKKLDLLAKGVAAESQLENENLALAQTQAHESEQAEAQRQHERQAAERQAQIQQEQATQQTGDQAMLAVQGHQQSLEAGAVSHGQALEQQDAAGQQKMREIKATPRPKPGAGKK